MISTVCFEAHCVDILRLDLPDPVTGGNKTFKLKYNVEEMRRQGLNRLLTFGGAFSNHIAAVAAAGKRNGFETAGIIRGEELNEDSNAVLKFAASCGMKLVFVSRENYRRRNEEDFCKILPEEHGPAYLLPEGGSNSFAVKGCMEILPAEAAQYDAIVCPVGTGATLAGIIASAKPHQHVTGIAVLNAQDLEAEVTRLLRGFPVEATWSIDRGHTFGGYANSSPALDAFIGEMKTQHGLPLDHVYSGKALFAVRELLAKGNLTGKRVLFIHTGGYAFG
jgi:1-aminocyclopropane-1-carboxylate deaminase